MTTYSSCLLHRLGWHAARARNPFRQLSMESIPSRSFRISQPPAGKPLPQQTAVYSGTRRTSAPAVAAAAASAARGRQRGRPRAHGSAGLQPRTPPALRRRRRPPPAASALTADVRPAGARRRITSWARASPRVEGYTRDRCAERGISDSWCTCECMIASPCPLGHRQLWRQALSEASSPRVAASMGQWPQ